MMNFIMNLRWKMIGGLFSFLLLFSWSWSCEAMYYHNMSGEVTIKQVTDTGIDLIHGGILVLTLSDGVYLFHGDFDGSVWSDPTLHRRAKLYKRPIEDLSDNSTYIQFADDLHHQNIVDVMYSEITGKIYVLFMGNAMISVVDPETMVASDFNVFEDLDDDNQMGKLVLSDTKVYGIYQLDIISKVISYDIDDGSKLVERDLAVPAAHGGIYFNRHLYVTTSQNNGTRSMLYKMNPTTLRVEACRELAGYAATHECSGMVNPYTNVPYIFVGFEYIDELPTYINNISMINGNNLNDETIFNTNTEVQGPIFGVKSQNGKVWVTRGSSPGTIEMIDPWQQISTFFTLTGYNIANGSPEVIGNTLYIKNFPRLYTGIGTSNLFEITIN